MASIFLTCLPGVAVLLFPLLASFPNINVLAKMARDPCETLVPLLKMKMASTKATAADLKAAEASLVFRSVQNTRMHISAARGS